MSGQSKTHLWNYGLFHDAVVVRFLDEGLHDDDHVAGPGLGLDDLGGLLDGHQGRLKKPDHL